MNKNVELFYFRLLLCMPVIQNYFKDVRHTIRDQNYAMECLNEIKDLDTPKQMQYLFGYICTTKFSIILQL